MNTGSLISACLQNIIIQNVPDQDVRSLKNVNRPWNRLHQINDHFESK